MKIMILETDLSTAIAMLAVWAGRNSKMWRLIKTAITTILPLVNTVVHIQVIPQTSDTPPYSITPLQLYDLINNTIE